MPKCAVANPCKSGIRHASWLLRPPDPACGAPTARPRACAVSGGSEEYADEEGGLGLATLRKEHVSQRDGAIVFDFPGKGGTRRVQAITDPRSRQVIQRLRHRRGGGPELLAYRDGRRWSDVRSNE